MRAKFGEEDVGILPAAAEATISTRRDAWGPVEECDPQMKVGVVRSRHALFAAGDGGLRYSYVQFLNTPEGKESFGSAIRSFWG